MVSPSKRPQGKPLPTAAPLVAFSSPASLDLFDRESPTVTARSPRHADHDAAAGPSAALPIAGWRPADVHLDEAGSLSYMGTLNLAAVRTIAELRALLLSELYESPIPAHFSFVLDGRAVRASQEAAWPAAALLQSGVLLIRPLATPSGNAVSRPASAGEAEAEALKAEAVAEAEQAKAAAIAVAVAKAVAEAKAEFAAAVAAVRTEAAEGTKAQVAAVRAEALAAQAAAAAAVTAVKGATDDHFQPVAAQPEAPAPAQPELQLQVQPELPSPAQPEAPALASAMAATSTFAAAQPAVPAPAKPALPAPAPSAPDAPEPCTPTHAPAPSPALAPCTSLHTPGPSPAPMAAAVVAADDASMAQLDAEMSSRRKQLTDERAAFLASRQQEARTRCEELYSLEEQVRVCDLWLRHTLRVTPCSSLRTACSSSPLSVLTPPYSPLRTHPSVLTPPYSPLRTHPSVLTPPCSPLRTHPSVLTPPWCALPFGLPVTPRRSSLSSSPS